METYSLSVATTGASVWAVGTSTPTSYNTFALLGGFNATQPSSSTFTSQDFIANTSSASTNSIYAIGQTGVGVTAESNNQWGLWLLLMMPPKTSTKNPQQMDLTITATP